MKAIGLMSGTSVDGIDAALVEIKEKNDRISVELIEFATGKYKKIFREKILAASESQVDIKSIAALNFEIGEKFASAAIKVCDKAGLPLRQISFIGSHGQTIAHVPERGATLQIGEPAVIAQRTGVKVVADFRTADMAAGGQGAPLTPMADFHFFAHPKKNRVVVNIGGITNITILKAGIEKPDDVVGFDTGFGNMPMDALAKIISGGKAAFDKNGVYAKKGRIDNRLLEKIMSHPFFKSSPPKSAGREQFGQHYLSGLLKNLKPDNPQARFDLMATLADAIAEATYNAVERFAMPLAEVDELILCGGGARNNFVVKMFEKKAGRIKVLISDEVGIPSGAREAMAFALLGYLTLDGKPGNIPAVTGARKAVTLGKIVEP